MPDFSPPNPKGDSYCERMPDGSVSNLGFHERMEAGISREGLRRNTIAIRRQIKESYPETTDEFLDTYYPIEEL